MVIIRSDRVVFGVLDVLSVCVEPWESTILDPPPPFVKLAPAVFPPVLVADVFLLTWKRPDLVNNEFRSRDWLSANQGPEFPDSVGS